MTFAWTHTDFLCVHVYRWPDIHRMKVKDKNLVIETATEEIFFRLVCGVLWGWLSLALVWCVAGLLNLSVNFTSQYLSDNA